MKKVLDFIKTHTFPLACALVALVAIGAFFLYVPTLFGGLQEQVDSRRGTHDALSGLITEQRTLPKLDPAVEPAPLTAFPTQPVIKAGKEATEALKGEAEAAFKTILQTNLRPLLVPGSLPTLQPLQRQRFFEAYRDVTMQVGERADRGIIRAVLKGALPPTTEELASIDAARSAQIYRENLQQNAQGVAQNQAQVEQMVAEMRAKLPLTERVSRAMSSQLYVSPEAVQIHPVWTSNDARSDALNDVIVFNAQFSLWLQLTVFEAISVANEGATNVFDAPVKHLVSLQVPMSIADASAAFATPGFGAPDDAGAAAGPVELRPDASVSLTPNFQRSPLGHVSNAMYDPIQMQMVLRIDYRRLPEVLAKLTRSELLRIRNMSYRTVDAGVALSQGYLYDLNGKTPLVEVNLDCDILMLREWTVPVMPDSVKRYFNSLSSPVVPQ
jgi:hypothetical protein